MKLPHPYGHLLRRSLCHKLTLMVMTSSVMLSGCHDNSNANSVLSFTPKAGDGRSYRIATQMNYQLAGSLGSGGDGFTTLDRVRYQVAKVTDDAVDFHVLSDYSEYAVDKRGTSSAGDNVPHDPWRAIMSSGFAFQTNTQTGKVTNFTGLNSGVWQTVKERNRSSLISRLKRRFVVPAIVATIPAKSGATVSLPSFLGYPATLTVDWVGEKTLSARIVSLPAKNRSEMVARAIIGRKDGWLQRLSVQSTETFHKRGTDVTVTRKLQLIDAALPMSSLRSALSLPDKSGQVAVPPFYDFDMRELPSLEQQDMIKSRVGVFNYQQNALHLAYGGVVPKGRNFGQFTLNHVQAFDRGGQPLPVSFWITNPAGLVNDDGIYRADFWVRPLGWKTAEKMRVAHHFEGQLTFQSGKLVSKTIAWQTNKIQTLNIGGLPITITPIKDKSHHYLISTIAQADHHLFRLIQGAFGKMAYEPSRIRMLALLKQYHPSSSISAQDIEHLDGYEVILTQLPKTVTLYVLQQGKKEVQTVQFVDQATYSADSANPRLAF